MGLNLVVWLKAGSADALSFFRAFASVVVTVFILLGPDWRLGSVLLLALAALSEPLDGRFARKWDFQRHWFPFARGSGKQANEIATAMFSILPPLAIIVRSFLASYAGWPDGSWVHFGVCATFGVFFLVMTLYFNHAKESKTSTWKAEKAEVHQAWLVGLIAVCCAIAINPFAERTSGFSEVVWWASYGVAIIAVTVLICVLTSDGRLTERRNERLHGAYSPVEATRLAGARSL